MQGEPIPEESRGHYGGSKYFSRIIGISDLEKDCIVRWKCPDCGGEWDRKENKLSDVIGKITTSDSIDLEAMRESVHKKAAEEILTEGRENDQDK